MSLDNVTPGSKVPEAFNVIIEIPMNADPIKYEVDKETGAIFVDRFMSTAMHYPTNYGYVPKTISGDGDPVDVLVITPVPLIPGVVVPCRAIGILKMQDEAGEDGKVLAVPTDSSYALVCHLDDKSAVDRLRRIRQVDERHHLTLLCRDLSELAQYARVDNRQFRLLKLGTPGPYTFLLEATKEVPRRVSHPQRKTIGLRVPQHPALLALLGLHGAPLLATTLILPQEEEPLNDAQEIREQLQHELGAVVDAGPCPLLPTTVVDLTGDVPLILRQGRGDAGLFT